MESRDVIVVFGRTGTGKSTYAERELKKYERVIIIDPKEEYEGLIFTNFVDMAEYYKKYKPDVFTFVCRFTDDSDFEYTFLFVETIENVLLIVEEAEIYISPYTKQSNFLKLVRYGRHHNVSIIAVARRASELSASLKANVTKLVSFRQTYPPDIAVMQAFGINNVGTLPDHEFVEIEL